MVAQPEQPPLRWTSVRVASWTETTAPTPERVETMSTRPQGGITTPPTRTQGLTTVMQVGTNYKYLRYLSILDPPNLGGIQGHAHRMMAIFSGKIKRWKHDPYGRKRCPTPPNGVQRRYCRWGSRSITMTVRHWMSALGGWGPMPQGASRTEMMAMVTGRVQTMSTRPQREKTMSRAVLHRLWEISSPRGNY